MDPTMTSAGPSSTRPSRPEGPGLDSGAPPGAGGRTSGESGRPGPGSAQRIAVVVNGNAKSVTAEVIETLDQILDSGDLFVSRRVEESEQIARTLVDRE